MPRKRIFEPALEPCLQRFTYFASRFWRNSTIWIQQIDVGLRVPTRGTCRKYVLDQGSRPLGRDESVENRVCEEGRDSELDCHATGDSLVNLVVGLGDRRHGFRQAATDFHVQLYGPVGHGLAEDHQILAQEELQPLHLSEVLPRSHDYR